MSLRRALLRQMIRWLGEPPPAPAAAPAQPLQRQYAYLGPDMAMTQLYDGQFIFVDPLDEEISAQMIARGYWEVWVEKAVRAMIGPGSRVIEVGANVGYYTLLMARDIGPAGKLDSYEANPRLVELLRHSSTFNGYGDRVTVHCNAVSDKAEPITFVMRRRRSGSGHVLAGGGDFGDETIRVEAQGVRLDDAFPAGGIDLLRIDAEGFEPMILAGARNLIAASPNLKICMEWDLNMMRPRADVGAMIDELTAAGLSFWLIEYDSTLSPLSREDLLSLPHRDIVAARAHPYHS